MKFKQRAFRMRHTNQEILELIAARINYGYNEQLLPDILMLMWRWKVALKKTLEEVK